MKKVMLLTIAVFMFAGCQNTGLYSNDVYTADRAKKVQFVTYGTVTSIRPIKIQTNANSDGSASASLGTIGGAVIGGLLGKTVGGGKGNNLATGAGVVAGAAVGNKIENDLSIVNGIELEIQQDDGSIIAVVQRAKSYQFYIGQAVRLVTNGKDVNVSPR